MSSDDASAPTDSETHSLIGRLSAALGVKSHLVPGLAGSASNGAKDQLVKAASIGVDNNGQPIVVAHRVYARRFWMLTMLSVVAMQQTSLWMSYSPIQTVVQRVYGWDNHTINLLVAWGPMIAFLMVPFTPLLVARIGLRGSVTVCALLGAACALLRCVTTKSPYALYLAHLGQILNAAAGPIATCVPSLLSAQWFEPEMRTTATAISTMAENLGSVAGFVAGIFVHTDSDFTSYILLEATVAIAILMLACADHMFPAVPPVPPSASSAAADKEEAALGERSMMSTFREMWALCGNRNFMLLSFMYAISVGCATAWAGVIDPILAPLGYNQHETGMIGLCSLLTGMVGGLVFAAVADRIRAVKKLLMGLFSVGIVSFTWLAVLCSSKSFEGDGSLVGVLISSSLGMFAIIGATALFYEEGCEAVFPLSPLAANAVLGMGYAFLMAMFFLMNSLIPPALMCWLLPSSCLVALMALAGFSESHTRSALDSHA